MFNNDAPTQFHCLYQRLQQTGIAHLANARAAKAPLRRVASTRCNFMRANLAQRKIMASAPGLGYAASRASAVAFASGSSDDSGSTSIPLAWYSGSMPVSFFSASINSGNSLLLNCVNCVTGSGIIPWQQRRKDAPARPGSLPPAAITLQYGHRRPKPQQFVSAGQPGYSSAYNNNVTAQKSILHIRGSLKPILRRNRISRQLP